MSARSWMRLLVGCAFLFTSPILQAATVGMVIRHATLRSQPNTHSPPIMTLKSHEDVDLIEATPTNNYYHVRTADGIKGYIYARNLELITTEPPPAPAPAPTPPPVPAPSPAPTSGGTTGVAGAFAPDWDKPVPANTTFDGPDGACGPTGDGGDSFTNLRKNRTDAPASYHEVTWKAVQSLPYPVAGRSLDQWTAQQKAEIQPYEGVPVSVTGYLVAIKVEDRGSGESTNCHFVNPEEVDWHMPFVEHSSDGEPTAVVVETTPRVRKSHPKWTTTNLSPWVNSQAPVRISGWTLLDPEHRAHLGKFRSTLWEIHPATKIEVFKDGQWMDLDAVP